LTALAKPCSLLGRDSGFIGSCQLAIGYRESPLSATYLQEGLHAGDREYWKNQVEVFDADYRVVALDQAGHGESGKGREAWTADSLTGDVEAVVKALGLKRLILVGH
jgi:pimeloyl-ACP methyl ester carboxylesterase